MTDDRNQERKMFWAMACAGLGVVVTLVVGATVNREREQETQRADNALVALQQACDQVERFGGHCVTPPSEVEDKPQSVPGPAGLDGLQGPAGRAPTQAEIDAAVARYLKANPPPAGEQGEQGPAGASGTNTFAAACNNEGGHLELRTFRLANGGTSVRVIACIPD